MLKDIFKFLFNEGDEDDFDDNVDIEQSPEETTLVSKASSDNSNINSFKNQSEVYTSSFEQKSNDYKEEQTSAINLIDEKVFVETKPKTKSIDIKVDDFDEPVIKREIRQVTKSSTDFLMNDVISPIYGTKEIIATDNDSTTKIKVKQNIIKKSPINTVISPIYGENQLEEFAQEAQKEIMKKSETQTQITNDYLIEDEDVVNIGIEEILSENSTSTNDDLVQCSLFGDDAVIRDDLQDNID